MATNFHLAPPAKTVDGLLAVPIDISTIDAVFSFDAAAQTAQADATITYEVGPTAGNPIFDLRQAITAGLARRRRRSRWRSSRTTTSAAATSPTCA